MNLLSIDTSTHIAGVGLWKESEARGYSHCWYSNQNHGRELMPAILQLLIEANSDITDITHIAVAQGPGGFSAVRVGIATAQGLSQPSGLPVIGIPTHRIQAFEHAGDEMKRIVSLITIGRKEVSFGIFQNASSIHESDFETGVCRLEDVALRFDDGVTILCGEGVAALKLHDRELPISKIRPPRYALRIARKIIDDAPNQESFVAPIYARAPSITKSSRHLISQT